MRFRVEKGIVQMRLEKTPDRTGLQDTGNRYQPSLHLIFATRNEAFRVTEPATRCLIDGIAALIRDQ